ncbi:hypothetical protein ABXJ76_03845 [Methylobacter sp. G7]|uniref:hypothetical protein n=1 Tax=Methylobacter sp. G7 TaxID=3230117 RepID=UPI003D809BD4
MESLQNRITKLSYWNNQMPTLSTVNQFTAKQPAFTLGGMRSLIFNAPSNGLAKSGAIVRIGRKVLIDEAKFFSWVESQNKVGA